VIFKGGITNTYNVYLLVKLIDKIICKDCKVIPHESSMTQHKLLVMDVEIKV